MDKKTAAKRLLVIILRILFVIFSIQFVREAFYKWDGYSYYIWFNEFLPDLSMSFIIWSLLGVICALIFWLITYGPSKILSKSLNIIRFEYILVWFTIAISLFIAKKVFNISLRNMGEIIGIDRKILVIIGVVFITCIVLIGRTYIERYTDKILFKVNSYISPLVWIFVLLLIVAIPLSVPVFKRGGGDYSHVLNYEKNPSVLQSTKKMDKKHSGGKRPNIVFVTWDAVSARDMQVYDYHRPTTPFLSEWAKDAILFKKAYSSSNWTPPTTMTMMTGQRPWIHKNWHLTNLYPYRKREHSLPSVLKDNGYATYSFVQNVNAHPDALGIKDDFLIKDKYYTFHSIPSGWNGFKLQVKYFVGNMTNSRIAADWTIEHPFFIPFSYLETDTSDNMIPVENVYNRFLEHISLNPAQPYFAWLHVEPPHLPFLPPEPFMGMFGDSDKFNTLRKQEESKLWLDPYGPERQGEVDILKKRYDEFIVYSDYQFKLLMSRLAGTVDMSRTIIIFSADHGTSFEKGLVGHGGLEFFESQVHIPLIIKIPMKRGMVTDVPVEQVDIPPTILEFAGISTPEWMEGRSLVPLIGGKPFEPRPIFSQQLEWSRAIGDHPIDKGSIAVWDGDYKLVHYIGFENMETELYDLKNDPGEAKNIAEEQSEIAQRLIKIIEKNLSKANKKITQARTN
jgi:arylsulfatase A-like enzyme